MINKFEYLSMTSRHLILILECRLGFQSLIYYQKQLFADLLQNSVLKTFAIFTWKHLCWSLFLTMLQAYYKETYTQVCSCEYCKIFKNSFFKEHLLWLLVHFIQMVSFFSLEKNNMFSDDSRRRKRTSGVEWVTYTNTWWFLKSQYQLVSESCTWTLVTFKICRF